MGPSDAVVHVANRKVNGVICVLTSCDRDGRLVRAEYHGDKHGPMCRGVHRNDILSTTVSEYCQYSKICTYTLVPGPVPAHKVTVPSFSILKVAVWSVVNI